MDVPRNGDTLSSQAVEAAMAGEIPGTGVHGAAESGDVTMPQATLPDMLDVQELKSIIEAMLFVSQEPLSLDRLATLLSEVPKAELDGALRSLQQDYNQPGRGLHLVEIAGGFRMVTRQDCAPWVKRLEKVKPAPKLSRSALETLAIVAYKQPVVRAEIEHIRGVEASGVLRTLLERKLVRMVGRKEMPGRPIMYGTTKLFLEHFGLGDLSDLPPLREFKELGEPEQAMLPHGDQPLLIHGELGDPSVGAGVAVVPTGEDPESQMECELPS